MARKGGGGGGTLRQRAGVGSKQPSSFGGKGERHGQNASTGHTLPSSWTSPLHVPLWVCVISFLNAWGSQGF